MNIRIMTLEDYEKVYQLWTSTPGMGLRSLDDSKEGIKKFLLRNPRTCFVAQSLDEIAGVILSGHDGRRGFIYHAAVREKDRGKGIGAALTREVEKAMKSEGIHKINLVVFAHNDGGNAFWEKQGYETRPDLTYRSKSLNDENQ